MAQLIEDYEVVDESVRNLQAKAKAHTELRIETKQTMDVIFEAFLKRLRLVLIESGELP